MIKLGTLISFKFNSSETVYGIVEGYYDSDFLCILRVTRSGKYNDLIHETLFTHVEDLTIIGE